MSQNENDTEHGGEHREENAGLPAVPLSPEEFGALMRPLADLAEAFQQNTETLRSLADSQARMGRRIERGDRSEAMIQSTEALNDTFRGVRRAQENLAGRLEKEQRRPWVYLVIGFLASAALVGGGLWFVLDWLADRDETTTRAGAEVFTGALVEKDAQFAALSEVNSKLSVDLARAQVTARELTRRVEDLLGRVDALETTNRNLRSNQVDMDELKNERTRLADQNVRLEDELAAARRELKTVREELAGATKRLAKLEKAAAPAGEAAAPSPTPDPEEPATDPIPEGAVTDPRQLDRVKTVLNRLLAETAGGAYRFERIGGLRGKMLYDVVILSGRDRGGGGKKFEARQARVAVDSAGQRIEIRLSDGHITWYGVRARFWDDRYVLPLANVATDPWVRSGLTIFETI